jgi:hypothetical protein
MKPLFALAVALAACGCTPTIVMKNPQTGEVAQCRGDSMDWNPRHAATTCATGYAKAGWVRMN